MFDRGFIVSLNVYALEGTSGLQERPDKTTSQISKHCMLHAEPRHPNGKTNNTTILLSCATEQFLPLIWVYSVELLLRTFYYKVSILIVALISSGH